MGSNMAAGGVAVGVTAATGEPAVAACGRATGLVPSLEGTCVRGECALVLSTDR